MTCVHSAFRISPMSTNGSGNGHDPDDKKVVKFPTLAQRDQMRRAEREEEERWRREYRKQSKASREPFLNIGNIPPFSRALALSFLIINIPLLLMFNDAAKLMVFYNFGFIPGMYTGTFEWSWTGLISPITHIFIHASWMHLVFNTIMGLVLCMFFEKLYGARATAKFFILCSLSGALFYFLSAPFSTAPVIGASGGISGFFGALIYITMVLNPAHPFAQRMGKRGPWPILVFWGLLIVVPGLLMGGSMAWQAHLGGYVAGIALLIQMQKGKLRL